MSNKKKKTTFVDISTGEYYDEWIGSGSQWESPFKLNVDGKKEKIKQLYKEWIEKEDWLMEDIPSLQGLKIGGSSIDVHGEVLIELADGKETKGEEEEQKPNYWQEEDGNWYIKNENVERICMNTEETAKMLLRLLKNER